MPLIHVEWFRRPVAKRTAFAPAITRVCEEVLGANPEDVEILCADMAPAHRFVGGQSCAAPPDGRHLGQ